MLLGIYSYDAHYIEGASDPPPLLPGRAFPQPCRCAHPLLEPSTHAGFKSVLPCQLSLFAFQSLSSEAWGSGCLPNLVCQLGRGAVLGTRHRLFIKTDVLACVVQGPRSATPPCPPPPRGFSHDGNSARLAAQFLSSFPEAGGGTGNGAVLAPACLTCYCSCHPSHTSWPGHETGLPPGPWGWSHPPWPFSKPNPPSTLSASLVAGAEQAPCGRAHLCGSGLRRVGVQAAAAVY